MPVVPAGGFGFHGPWGPSVSSNITSQSDELAGYSDDKRKTMIDEGVRPYGSRMLPPIGYANYTSMTQQDLDAVILYLLQLPPLLDPE